MKNRMYMKTFIGILTVFIAVSLGAPKNEIEANKRELDVLKQYLNSARDSLQREMTKRWRTKQRQVEQRKLDKDELARQRDVQERVFSELSRVKEENFAKERILEDERNTVKEKKDEWDYVLSNFEETFKKESKDLFGSNPLYLEQRRKDLEDIRRDFRLEKNLSSIFSQYLGYRMDYLEKGGNASVLKQVVIPDEGSPQDMTVVSFGNVFAYGINNSGVPYIVRQTGKLGAAKYSISEIGAPRIREQVQKKLTKWTGDLSIEQPVPVDIMQNDNSRILLSGKKIKTTTKIASWFKSGGPVLVPLVLLLLWAAVLIVLKIFQFKKKHKSNRDLYDNVVEMLKKKEHDKAQAYAGKHKGVVAKVVTTCLEHSKWNRSSAEKAVKEILVDEYPQLNKHLATLAVIAGAAPLLGLLGTVTGMISLFEVITHYGTGDPKIMAGGISEALITTQTGLAVAIPIMLVHNFLRNQSQHIQSEMEKNALRILNRLWPEV